jgi:outer membrane biosynthesis protein TonB
LSKYDEVSVSDIQKELFEGDNVVMNLSDGGLKEIRNKMKESMQEKEFVEEDVVIVETQPEVKDEVQEEPKVEVQEEPKVEVKEEPKVEVQEEPKVEVQEEPVVEPQTEVKEEVVNKPSTNNNKNKKKKNKKKK